MVTQMITPMNATTTVIVMGESSVTIRDTAGLALMAIVVMAEFVTTSNVPTRVTRTCVYATSTTAVVLRVQRLAPTPAPTSRTLTRMDVAFLELEPTCSWPMKSRIKISEKKSKCFKMS